MKIPVTSSIQKFYKQVISLMASFAPIKDLNKRQKELLAELLYQNYKFRYIKEDSRFLVLFSTENRKKIQEKVNMNAGIFDQNLSLLRNAGIILPGNKLPTFLCRILPADTFEFTILFNIIKDEDD